MSLPDAAAEFARQLVTALAGDAGRAERAETERSAERVMADRVITERDQLKGRLDKLRGAVQEVLRQEGDLLTEERAELLRAAVGDTGGGEGGLPAADAVLRVNVTSKTAARLKYVTQQRDDLLAAAKWVLRAGTASTAHSADATLRQVVERIERGAREEG
jgi:hypothetical protein